MARGRRDRRLDGAGRPHHRRTRLQRRRPQHDQRRPPRLRMGARPRRQSAHERRAQRLQRLVGRRRAGPLRDRVQPRPRGAARGRDRPGLRRGQLRARCEHRREPCLGAGSRRGRQRDRPPTSSRRSRGAGRRRAAPRSSPRSRPTATGSRSAGPGGEAVVQGTSFAAPQVTGAVALLTGDVPGRDAEAIIDALVRGARDVGAPGADTDTGAGILNVAQAAALLAGADHAGPRVNLKARWSKDADHPGLVLSGRAHERGGGTSDGVKASAFIARHGIPASTFPLSATPLDPTFAALTGTVTPRQVRRLVDGRHTLFVRARDAAGNWGPVRAIVIPIDRAAPAVRVSGARTGDVVDAVLHVREHGSGLVSLRYRVEVAGHPGRWRRLDPAERAEVTLHAKQGRRAILRVRAVDLVGNEAKAGFVCRGRPRRRLRAARPGDVAGSPPRADHAQRGHGERDAQVPIGRDPAGDRRVVHLLRRVPAGSGIAGRRVRQAPASVCREKNSSAVRVFVCCSPSSRALARGTLATRRRPGRPPRRALRRELQDPRSVRIEPDLRDEPAVEALEGELELQDEDRPEDREVVELNAVGRVCAKSDRCSFENSLRSDRSPATTSRTGPSWAPLHRAGADESAGHRVDLDAEVRRLAGSPWKARRERRAAASRPCRRSSSAIAARARRGPLVEGQIRRVEEEHLADLRLERVETEPLTAERWPPREPSASARRCRRPSSARGAPAAPCRRARGAACVCCHRSSFPRRSGLTIPAADRGRIAPCG